MELTHVRESARGQSHRSTAHKRATHDEEIRVRLLHIAANRVYKRQDDERGNSVRDESSTDQDQASEYNKYCIQREALDFLRNCAGNGMQETGRVNCLSKRETTGGKDNDSPEEVIEVLFSENTRSEEKNNRDNSHHAHLAEDPFELVGDAPQYDSSDGSQRDKPLDASKSILDGPDRDDHCASSGLKRHKEEDPDYEDGDEADWDSNEEPNSP